MRQWSIPGLQSALMADLVVCKTPLEKSLCAAIGGKEICERAAEIERERGLDDVERAIAGRYGYH